jgi:c-di-GMP-binding flagellar brake protein YcgR
MSDDATVTEVSEVSFESLKLRPGSSLKIHHSNHGSPNGEVQLLAAVKGQNVMVALKSEGGVQTGLEAGRDYVIRGFSGQYDFSFSSHVTQIFKAPFPYAMLAYPGTVEARTVRKSVRAKTALPATASPHGKDIALAVILADLSASGALLDSSATLGNPGELVKLAFAVDFENNKIDLALLAAIRHVHKSEVGSGYRVGIEFKDVSQNDKLVLHFVAQSYAARDNLVVTS